MNDTQILMEICQVLVADRLDWSAETLDAIAEILYFHDWIEGDGEDLKINDIKNPTATNGDE